MILFLYGEDNYCLKQKVKAIKQKYLAATDIDVNCSSLSIENDKDFEKIKSDIEAMPFLAEKRLVCLENYLSKASPKKLQDQLKDYLDKVPKNTITIFIEEGLPDKRSGLFKGLIKKAEKVWEFKPLKPYELEKWIKQTVLQNKGKIDYQAVQLLASYVGPNLWQMTNEIEKLILYKNKNIINVSDVELLVKAKMDTNIFNLIDALGNKNDQKAIQLLEELLESGEPEIYILTMIIYQFRNILIIKDLLERGENKSEINKKIRMHPYVLTKTMNQCKNFTLSRLKGIYQCLADTDLAIKTGKIESKIALNLLLAELSK